MSPTTGPRVEVQRFTLRAAPPLRALAIGSAGAMVGAVLIVLWRVLDLPLVVLIVGVLLLVLAIALVVAALLLTARLRTLVVVGPQHVEVRRRGQSRRLAWSEIERVTLRGPRLTLIAKQPGGDAIMLNPRTPEDPVFSGLLTALRQRLDHDRGYGRL